MRALARSATLIEQAHAAFALRLRAFNPVGAVQRAIDRLWPFAVLALLGVYPAVRSWRTGLDPIVDFGRELYVPWRLSEGDVLYRHVAYFNGPLSPYLNAAWFRLFGASLTTLMVANLIVLTAITAIAYRLLTRIATRGAALAAAALIPLLFGFGNYGTIANYNFITPYSHELTHGLLVALLALAASWQGGVPRRRTALLAGLFVGAALLTKPEMGTAAAVGAASSQAALCWTAGAHRCRVIRQLTIMAAGAIVGPLVAVAWLATLMPLPAAVDSCLGAWRMAGMAEIRHLEFYRECLGTLDLQASLRNIVVSLAHGAALLGAADILDRRVAADRRRWWALALGLCGGALLIVEGYYWPIVERAFPAWLAVLAAWWATRVWRSRRWQRPHESLGMAGDQGMPRPSTLPPAAARLIQSEPISTETTSDYRLSPEWTEAGRGDAVAALRLGWCLFALTLLAKIALFSRVMHYGFALALPAALTMVVAALDWVPRRGRAACRGATLPWLFLPLLAAYLLAYQVQHSMHIDRDVAHGVIRGDEFDSAASTAPAAEAVRQLIAHTAGSDAVAVLPEGVMLNYLARRASATRFITWMPPEVIFFGEEQMRADLAATSPEWIVLAPRDLDEYGYEAFGDDYCRTTADWIESQYAVRSTWDEGRWRLLRRRTP